jgi:sensor domain CHASE-containing protein
MKIRLKTLLIVAVTLACLTIALYVISRVVLVSGFATVEKNNTMRNVNRVVDAVHTSIENLTTKEADWALWDDCYKFIQDGNKEFIESNIKGASSLVMIKINLMLFVNTSNTLVFSKMVDLDEEKEIPLPESIKKEVLGNPAIMSHNSETSIKSGIVMLPEGPLYVASRPILTSSEIGRAHV